MAAINNSRLGKFVGTVYFRDAGSTGAYTRLASVRGLVVNMDATAKTVEVNADDTGTVFKGFTPQTNFEFEFLENADADIIAKLFNGTVTITAGTPVSVTAEAHGTGWTVGKPFALANKNGDNTAVSSIVVKANTTTLAAGTDYSTYVGDGTNGTNGYTYIVPLTAQTLAITVGYSYTPAVLKSTSLSMTFQEAAKLQVKIEAADPADPTKVRTIIGNEMTFNGTYSVSFVDVVESGNITGSTMVFTSARGSTVEFKDGIDA